MATTPSLDDLKDGRFATEPMKGKKNPVVNWGLGSRHLMIHLFFNVLGEKAPRNLKKGTLPSIDVEALEKMNTPIAAKLADWRSKDKSLGSLTNAADFVFAGVAFGHADPHPRALIRFNAITHDNVERIFAVAERSIPLNLDKRARNAFVVPKTQVTSDAVVSADPANAKYLAGLFA